MKNKIINYGKQTLTNQDCDYVLKTLKSDFLTQGKEIEKFEKELLNKFGGKYCSVVNNGTSALNIIAKILNWKKNDNIITTPLTFLATANCIVNSGATPIFADIDSQTHTLDPQRVEDLVKKIKVKAVIGVDYAGHPCDWSSLYYLSKKYKFKLINDACHSLGAKINDNEKYAIKYADFVTHSYHPVKAITTGEGGAIILKDKKFANKIKIIRSHGIIKKKKFKPWYYEINDAGFNYRITDFQCALGISQLKKLDNFIKARRKISKVYDKYLKQDERFVIPESANGIYHAYHLYPLQINFSKLKVNKLKLFNKFKKQGINLQVHYIPIHLQPFYKKKFGYKKNQFTNVEKFYEREVSLPIYPSLSKKYILKTIKMLLSLN